MFNECPFCALRLELAHKNIQGHILALLLLSLLLNINGRIFHFDKHSIGKFMNIFLSCNYFHDFLRFFYVSLQQNRFESFVMGYDNYGYMRVTAAMPVVHVADCKSNAEEMARMAGQIVSEERPSLVAFPELGICGYTCADLFGSSMLLDEAERAVVRLLEATAGLDCILVYGAPVRHAGRLYNCAIVSRKGRILGIVPKTYLAGNAEFYEPRWFESARVLPAQGARISFAGQDGILLGQFQLFRCGNVRFGVELCQDLWAPLNPATFAAMAGAQLIVNLSASNEILLKHEYRKNLVSSASSRLFCAYLYCSAGYGESTQDLVWAGSSLISEYGSLLAENERFLSEESHVSADIDIGRMDTLRARETTFRFEGPAPAFAETDCGTLAETDFVTELKRHVEAHPFVPQGDEAALDRRCKEIISAQVAGLQTRLDHIRCRKAVIGVSGGLDSTLALLVTVFAFDRLGIPRGNITGITMPGFGTTARTHGNSEALMELLGVTSREISIIGATRRHFEDIGQDESVHDLTYENSQARERTQILMDMAGKEGGIVIGTGDLSELALGWCTYNGDHMSMYGVNAGVPKTLVRTLVVWAARHRFDGSKVAEVLLDIADTPISPELIPAAENGEILQKTEDLVGPYELHDFYLYNFFRGGYSPEKMLFLARKAFNGIFDDATLRHWLGVFMKRFFSQQFKRSCLPDGPKVGSVSLSPRGDWRMPSDVACPWNPVE